MLNVISFIIGFSCALTISFFIVMFLPAKKSKAEEHWIENIIQMRNHSRMLQERNEIDLQIANSIERIEQLLDFQFRK